MTYILGNMKASSAPNPGRALFREEQRFTQWWLWVLVILPAGLAWWPFVQQVIGGQPVGQHPAPYWLVWVIWLVIGIGLPLLFGRVSMVVEVFDDAVLVRYRPFARRTITLAEIERAEAAPLQPRQGVRRLGRQGLVQDEDGVQRERQPGGGTHAHRRPERHAGLPTRRRVGGRHRGATPARGCDRPPSIATRRVPAVGRRG